MSERHLWWQRGVIYQVYPRSFADSNGDGIGDLRGIRSRLDYLEWLGIDAIWLSPIFPSPMVDFGYDVEDYTGIDPVYGEMPEFDRLLAEVHRRGMRLILDFVPNHSSDRHPWFVESRSSLVNPKRDWYLWRDPGPDGGAPNNWLSEFGGSAWTFDEGTGQYYYHAFAEEQPDLNWRTPEVRRAMFDVMRFWLDRGVDGFRVDVMWHMLKDEHFRDNPPNPDYREGDAEYRRLVPAYSTDQPQVHEVVAQMRGVLEEYHERLMIGEIYLPVDRLIDYYGRNGDGAHLPFNFHLLTTPWDAREIELVIDRYEGALPENAWPNWVLGNHDKSRVATRIGASQARVAAVLLLTLRGTPTMYYGDEIGMHDVEIPPQRTVDVRDEEAPGRGFSRDPQRTPMQWEPGEGAGFTNAERPWLPIADDADRVNVVRQRDDPGSMLSLYRRLLQLRREERALSVGWYTPVPARGSALAFVRGDQGRRFLVALNLAGTPAELPLEPAVRGGRVVLSAKGGRDEEEIGERLELEGDDAVVAELP